MDLKGKKILFLSPSFFNYEKKITEELRRRGALVTFISLSKDSILYKIPYISTLYKTLKYRNERKLFTSDFDILFVIKGENLQEEFLELFNEANPSAYKVLYQYDSLKRYPDLLKYFPYFDKVLSFEYEDCKEYNLIFRPLFYIPEYTEKRNQKIKYDLSSVSSFYPNRLNIYEKIRKSYPEYSYYLKLYIDWRLMVKKFLKTYFQNLDLFTVKSVSCNKLISIYSKSRIILDIPNNDQQGLTIRTLEVLALEKKMITTNKSIVNYDFYHPNNILVLDNNYAEIDDFLHTPYKKINEKQMQEYSIYSFINDIFVLNK